MGLGCSIFEPIATQSVSEERVLGCASEHGFDTVFSNFKSSRRSASTCADIAPEGSRPSAQGTSLLVDWMVGPCIQVTVACGAITTRSCFMLCVFRVQISRTTGDSLGRMCCYQRARVCRLSDLCGSRHVSGKECDSTEMFSHGGSKIYMI